ncbi:MAG: hypothetical protein ACXVJW_17045 [Acidimicrobiia bacterium]
MSPTELQSHVWTPCPDCAPFHVRCSADVLTLAIAWPELPEFGVLLALLDSEQRVEHLVTNPSPDEVFFPDRIVRSGASGPVHGVALFTLTDAATDGGASDAFASLHLHYREAGIRFVDWVRIDVEAGLCQSMRLNAPGLQEMTVDYLRAGTCG